jgi:hypothetical protein
MRGRFGIGLVRDRLGLGPGGVLLERTLKDDRRLVSEKFENAGPLSAAEIETFWQFRPLRSDELDVHADMKCVADWKLVCENEYKNVCKSENVRVCKSVCKYPTYPFEQHGRDHQWSSEFKHQLKSEWTHSQKHKHVHDYRYVY